jgi:hypothetical protein
VSPVVAAAPALAEGATGRPGPAAAGVLLVLLVAAIAAPLLGAGFASDDWLYLAVGRHLDHPFMPFTTGMLHEYFYRPLTIASWWLAERVFGVWAPGHYALSLLIHLGAAGVLAALVRRAAPRIGWLPPMAAGALFALLPATIGTAAWLSNRNELMAVAAGLAVLLTVAGDASRPRAAVTVVAMLVLALASKETGVLFAGLAVLWLAWRRWHGETVTPWHWPALVLPVIALLLLRSLLVDPAAVGLSWQGLVASAPAGIMAWWALLPRAFAGFQHALLPDAWLFLMAMVPVVLALLAFRQGAGIAPLTVGAALLVLSPALLQWPVTSLVLTDPEAFRHVVNLRFYYSAGAGLAVLMACGLAVRSPRLRPIAIAAVVLAGVLLASGSSRLVRSWADHSRANSAGAMAVARSALEATGFEPGCRLILERPTWPPGFPQYADAMVKAAAPRGHPVLGCALFTPGPPPWHAVFDGALCGPQWWPARSLRNDPAQALIRPLGNLCLAGFESPAENEPGFKRVRLP